MGKKALAWSAVASLLVVFAAIQFVPSPPLQVPAQLPAPERAAHRLLNFEGIHNFRDLGGYPAADGRRVRWGVLYRSGTLAHATRQDLEGLAGLGLRTLVDFRSAQEKVEEPNRLPDPLPFEVVDIPTLDDANQALVGEIFARIESGDFDGFDPGATMISANRQFATEFTPQFRQFLQQVLAAQGAPVAWHCSAGKDRTGWAAAVLLRILGVPEDVVMRDYLASAAPSIESRSNQLRLLRLFKGDQAADKLAVLMGVEAPWLQAGFDEVQRSWGGFDAYVRDGLGLSEADVTRLRATLLQ
ncbi:MAG: tyrosine protein phosphatase [Halioglobus sp.]|nr:tyrosine protein phosphatase [Halioglobus sp.]|tara:strand:+ start:1627 stop:2526 length:900 start_codon:yes stop_codon:yes gene_type:complete